MVMNSEVLTVQRTFTITAFALEHFKKSLSDAGLIPETRIELWAPAQTFLIGKIEVGMEQIHFFCQRLTAQCRGL